LEIQLKVLFALENGEFRREFGKDILDFKELRGMAGMVIENAFSTVKNSIFTSGFLADVSTFVVVLGAIWEVL